MNIWNNDVVAMFADIEKNKADYFETEDEITDDMIWERAYEEVEELLNCEKSNLNISLNGKAIAIGKISRWNGTASAHKICESNTIGEVISEVISSFEGENSFSVDISEGELVITQYGHDNPTSPSIIKVREMTADYDDLESYSTEILMENSRSIAKQICDVYGWELDGVKNSSGIKNNVLLMIKNGSDVVFIIRAEGQEDYWYYQVEVADVEKYFNVDIYSVTLEMAQIYCNDAKNETYGFSGAGYENIEDILKELNISTVETV